MLYLSAFVCTVPYKYWYRSFQPPKAEVQNKQYQPGLGSTLYLWAFVCTVPNIYWYRSFHLHKAELQNKQYRPNGLVYSFATMIASQAGFIGATSLGKSKKRLNKSPKDTNRCEVIMVFVVTMD